MRNYNIQVINMGVNQFCPVFAATFDNETYFKYANEFIKFNSEFSIKEINYASKIVVKEFIGASSFADALNIAELESDKKLILETLKISRGLISDYENKIIKKFGKKLRGKKRQTKLNSFLR